VPLHKTEKTNLRHLNRYTTEFFTSIARLVVVSVDSTALEEESNETNLDPMAAAAAVDQAPRTDESEEDHNDLLDLDDDLLRLSAATLSALESITDEVDAMEQKVDSASKKKKKKSTKHRSSFDEESDSSGDGGIVYGIAGKQGEEMNPTSLRHIDDIELSDDEHDDSMSLDGSLDGSIAVELDALRMVAQEIEKELQFQDSETMKEAMESLQNRADDPTKRILTSDDHEIIRRALFDEMTNYEPKNAWERFMKRYQLEGLSDQDKTYALTALCAVVWSFVIYLVFQVKYGEII
jgi:hypothetical protein